MSNTHSKDLVTDVVRGFLEALILWSENDDEGYEFSAHAQSLATEFVEEHLKRFAGIDWQRHGDAVRLGQYLYFTSAGFGDGYWGGDYSADAVAMDEMTERHDWLTYLDDDGKLGLLE